MLVLCQIYQVMSSSGDVRICIGKLLIIQRIVPCVLLLQQLEGNSSHQYFFNKWSIWYILQTKQIAELLLKVPVFVYLKHYYLIHRCKNLLLLLTKKYIS